MKNVKKLLSLTLIFGCCLGAFLCVAGCGASKHKNDKDSLKEQTETHSGVVSETEKSEQNMAKLRTITCKKLVFGCNIG